MTDFPLIDRIIAHSERLDVSPAAAYHRSYREFVRYFADAPVITEHHLIIGANFTYGWMPTILEFGDVPFARAVETLNCAKSGAAVSDDDITELAHLINNSIVGASKLLHFVAPTRFAIWDSRVAGFVHGRISTYRLNRTRVYRAYLDACEEAIQHPAFAAVHAKVQDQLGYEVTPMRAIELVMFTARGVSLPAADAPPAADLDHAQEQG